MIWIPLFILNALVMIVCYITNPIVCLFSNEEGELPGFLSYWQTWDDSLNPRFFIVDKVPQFLKYDYDRHYEEYWGTTPKLQQYGRKRCFARVLDPNFTFKEKIQRYVCRVLWLMRNCGYGFSFYLFGRWAYKNASVEHEKRRDDSHYVRWGYDASESILTRVWWFKIDWYLSKHVHVEGFLGWKINFPFKAEAQYAMIAHRLVPIKIKL